ncbi:DUF222 domain-containing protein [Naasia aerilata]|nr:DUF222 domain-containing protein [Naasia aerilata]
MERPSDTLAQRAAALAERVTELAWAGDAAELSQVVAGSTDTALLDLASQIGTLANLVDAVAVRVSGEIAARSARDVAEPLARRLGERSAAMVVATAGHISPTRAADWCRTGQQLAPRSTLAGEPLPRLHPELEAALDGGRIGADAARIIVRTLEEIGAHTTPEQQASAECFLLSQADVLTLPQLARLGNALRDHWDPEGAAPREEALRAKSGLRMMPLGNGMVRYVIDAHPEADGWLKTAIQARTAPAREVRFIGEDDAPTDESLVDKRPLAQRRLDALVSIARDSIRLDDGDMSGTPVVLLVTMTQEALVTGIGTATIFGVDEPISAATARRLACDAKIIPVVLGGESQPLDLGQGRRLFSEAQRYAMAVRDGGCGWGTCNVPPSQCEAAHIESWDQAGRPHGPTDISNGLLFCKFHHRIFDNEGWAVRFEAGIPYLIPPPWVDPDQRPRRAGRLPGPPGG